MYSLESKFLAGSINETYKSIAHTHFYKKPTYTHQLHCRLGKWGQKIVETCFSLKCTYLGYNACDNMGTLQVYLDPFFDALLYCVLGTPGSTEFVLIESVN